MSKQTLGQQFLRIGGDVIGSLIFPVLGVPEAIAMPTGFNDIKPDIETVGVTIQACEAEREHPALSEDEWDRQLELLDAIFDETSALSEEDHQVLIWQEMVTQMNRLVASHGVGPLNEEHPLTVRLERLEAVVTDITSPEQKIDVLLAIATTRTTMGQEGKALDDLAIATRLAHPLSHAQAKARRLNAIATAYIALDHPTEAAELLNGAIDLTPQIDDVWQKPVILQAIATAYLAIGNQARAADAVQETIEAIQTMDSSPAKLIRWDNVIALIQQLDDEALKIDLLGSILAAQEDFAQTNAADPLVAIATATVGLQDDQAASALLVSVMGMVSTTDNPFSQLKVVEAIATAAGERLTSEDRHTLLAKVSQATEHIDEPWSHAKALVAIATAYAKIDNSPLASNHLTAALMTIATPHSQYIAEALAAGEAFDGFFDANVVRNLYISNQIETLQLIATTTVLLQDEQASMILAATAEMASQTLAEHEYGLEVIVWTDIAQQYAQRGQMQEANRLLTQAVPIAQQILAQEIESNSEGVLLLHQIIASAYIDIGQPNNGAALLRDAIAHTQHIQNERERFGALSGLVSLHGDLGEVELAREGLELAIDQTSFSEAYPSNAPILFRRIAEVYGQLGDRPGMDRVLRQSLEVPQARLRQARATISNTMATARLYRQFGQTKTAAGLLDKVYGIVHDEFKAPSLAALDEHQRVEYLSHLEKLAVEYDAVGQSQKTMDVMGEAIAIINAMDEVSVTSTSSQPRHSRSTFLNNWIEIMGQLRDDGARLESLAAVLPSVTSLTEDWQKRQMLTLMVKTAMMPVPVPESSVETAL